MMDDNLTKRYQDFFRDSEAGQKVIKDIEGLILTNHQKAEDDPDRSIAYVHRAKGNREALSLIKSLTMEMKKQR